MKSGSCTILTFPGAARFFGRRSQRKDFLNALRASTSAVVVDLSGCKTLNHNDVDLLLECAAQVAGRDKQVRLVAGSRVIRVLLDVTRISSLVPVFDSVKEALGESQDSVRTAVQVDPDVVRASQTQLPWSA
jgi:ABC-type transporter Mla MlaB component